MLKSHGMHSYVLNNNLKSLGLLAGFLLVVQLMFAAVWAFTGIFQWNLAGFGEYLAYVLDMTWRYAPGVVAGSLVWAFLAFLYYKHIVRGMTGLQEVSRNQEPRLYNIVENLSISTGLTTPRIEVSESPAMNAFAMGLTPATSTIGVTRGLLNALTEKELEAVIAHEMTHIRTLDVRLMTLATIFCGIIFSIGWFLTYRARELSRQAKTAPLVLVPIVIWFLSLHAVYPGSGPWPILALTTVLIFAALLISLSLRFAISRNREFVADLGACELTKNPEALIRALVKIHGRNLIPHVDPTVQAMMISAPSEGIFASHPDIEDRINAIVTYAATHLNGLRLMPAAQRLLPSADAGDVKTGFSITKMKYPAWVSKPLIVLPAIATGVLIGHVSNAGLTVAFDQLAWMPSLMQEFKDAPASSGTFHSNELRGTLSENHKHTGSVFDFIGTMSLGEWKIMLFYFLAALALSFGAKFLRSIGIETEFLRKLSGAPSKEMQSDWDEEKPQQDTRMNAASVDSTAQMARLNVAMDHAISAQRNYVPQAYQPHPQQTRAVFGKR